MIQAGMGKKRWVNVKKLKQVSDKIIRAFSLKRNMKKLFSDSKYESEEKEFEIFNAIKVYSICLIVLGNTFFFTLTGPI